MNNKYSIIKFALLSILLNLPLCGIGGGICAQIIIKGTITDAATKTPVAGVKVEAGKAEALTNSEGQYVLKTKGILSSASLTISRNGYTTSVVPLRGDSVINSVIYSDGFRPVMSPDAFTTAVTELSLEDVLAVRSGSDVRTISRGANAGMGSNMFIRGINTLNSNTQPLIVVDGVVWDNLTETSSLFNGFYENTFADIDVNDIEKVEVLKDASAIYGTKGSNGAIVITTKRSHSIVTKITADISYSFNFAPRQYDMMNASQFRSYLSESMKNSSSAKSLATSFATWLGTNTSSADYSTYNNNTNWGNEVYRTGNTQHYGIAVEGSDDIADYAFTIGYTGNKATVKSVDFSRLNARINANINVLRGFTIGTNMMFTYTTRALQDDGIISSTSPTFVANIKSPLLVPYSYTDDGTQLTNTLNDVDIFGITNPNVLLVNDKNSNTHYRFGIGLAPKWEINNIFSLDGCFNYMFANTKEHYFSPAVGVSSQYVNGNTIKNTVMDQSSKYASIYGDANFRYHQTLGRHDISARLGMRLLTTSQKSSGAEGHNTGSNAVVNLNTTLSYLGVNGIDTKWGNAALLLSAQYTYDNRYSVSGTLTTEASSRFGENAEGSFRMLNGSWATFPSAQAQWNIGNEAFLKNVRFISNADIHIGYGITGNDNIAALSGLSYIQSIKYIGQANGLQIGNIANDKLKWEVTRKFNAGVNIGFFNDRLTLGFDYFRHVTSDLLIYRTPDIVTGQTSYLTNGGELQNTGFEANIGARPIVVKDFSWMTNIALQHYKNKINSLVDGDYITDILGGQVITSVGNAVGLFYGYKTNGVYATTEQAEADGLYVRNSDTSISHFSAGDVRFVDACKDDVIDENDRQVIGDPNPTFTGSFFNRFTYNRFTFDVMCSYSYGGDVYNYARQQLEKMTNNWNQTATVVNRWKAEGQITDIPKAMYGDPMGNSRFSDRWIEDGSYFKIKNVKLSYQLPVENTYIHGLNFWIAADNLVTFTKYLGIDPEVSMNSHALYQGIDYGILANGRSFTMGIKINL